MKTLNRYIGMDLVKTTVMTTVAFTLGMTIVGIIEPLREYGVSGREVVSLMGIMLMLMLSLSLPIAALFSATIVYGRFSQDNELTACRASGISTMSVLKPGLILGLVVTVISLVMSNLIVPYLAMGAEKAIFNNLKGMAFAEINRKGVITEFSDDFIFRVDYADTRTSTLYGVTIARRVETVPMDPNDPDGPRVPREGGDYDAFITAESATIEDIISLDTGIYIKLRVHGAQYIDPTNALESQYTRDEYGPLDNPMEARELWVDWGTLITVVRDPTQSHEIRQVLQECHRRIAEEILVAELRRSINQERRYTALVGADGTEYELLADRAEMVSRGGGDDSVMSMTLHGEGPEAKVELYEVNPDGTRMHYVADRAVVTIGWSAFFQGGASYVSVELENVQGYYLHEDDRVEDPIERRRWMSVSMPLPAHIVAQQDAVSLDDLCANPQAYTRNAGIIEEIRYQREKRIPKVRSKAIAEMNVRLAYGVSCFLMVAMGSALGLIFRGGQVLNAIALTLVPAVSVMIMILMGKELIRSEDIEPMWGILSIWGGIMLILVATGIIYWRLSKK
jgi:lipopolysaccharide export LptBFGC system permease protein LptF